ncbi:MAG: hypothetical protein HRU04_01955 [Oceanospirillaceae bacterium]|nr:hypothetical protein [Oceanospirillaceae bacterium]
MRKFNISRPNAVSIACWTIVLVMIAVLATNLDLIVKLKGGGHESFISAEITENPYQINIYYFPKRKNSAKALTHYFEQQGYLVKTLKASELKNSQATKYSPSHFFFNKEDFGLAMEIKSEMGQVLGYPISAYKFSVSQSIPSMIIIFTEAEVDPVGEYALNAHKHEESTN